MSSGVPNSGPLALETSTLTAEPSLHPNISIFG